MLQGTLDEFPLIDVLGILKARNKTGRLDIERQAGRGLIYVRLGEPYYAESSLTRSLIGQKLVDIGAITDMQLRKALDRQAESGDRLGQILLTHGVISREHIASAVIAQIKDALSDLLAWETGEFKWEVGAEVEVEVPVYGGMLSDNGSIPLTPHVVPVTMPAQTPPVAQAIEVEEPAQPDVTQIDESPAFEPQVQPQLEVVHSPAVGGGSSDEESPPVPFDQTAAEPELHTAVENETEQQEDSEAMDENPSGDEPAEFDGSESAELYSSQAPSEDDSHEDEPADDDSHEDEPVVDESHEDEPVADESHEDEPVVDESHEDETVVDESHEDEPVADDFHDDVSVDDDSNEDDSDDEVPEGQPLGEVAELPQVEVVESYNGTRVIKSRPAPEFDEEFDHMFATTQAVAAELEADDHETEPLAEAPSFEEDPVDEAPAFEEDPVDESPYFEEVSVDEAPYFEADPVAEASMFVTEHAETAALDEAPWFEPADHQPVASSGFASPEAESIAETFESLAAAAPEAMTPEPPPPPPLTSTPDAPEAVAPQAPEAPESPVDEVPVDESDEAVEQEAPEEAPEEPAADIKLDRSSLVRELSDLLR